MSVRIGMFMYLYVQYVHLNINNIFSIVSWFNLVKIKCFLENRQGNSFISVWVQYIVFPWVVAWAIVSFKPSSWGRLFNGGDH